VIRGARAPQTDKENPCSLTDVKDLLANALAARSAPSVFSALGTMTIAANQNGQFFVTPLFKR
jgi:hypothetical protein